MRASVVLIAVVMGGILIPTAARADIRVVRDSEITSALEVKVGAYSPSIDSDFSGDGPYEEYFGSRTPIHLELEYDRQFWRGVGSFGAFVAIGYNGVKASAFDTDGSRSVDDTRMQMIPLRLGVVYRFDYLQEHWDVPLVLAAKLGVDYYAWFVKSEGGVADFEDEAGDRTVGRGATTGYHAAFALHLLLDFLAPGMAQSFDNNVGVNNTYAFAELMVARIDDFGSADSWDLSETTALFGLAFEF